MRSDWKETRLEDLCLKVITGGTPSSRVAEYYNNGFIPWLKTKEVNYCKIHNTVAYITQKGLDNSAAKMIPINSVIIAMYGQGDTAGRVAINKIPLSTNQACCNLIINSNIADYGFIYYYLKLNYKELVSLKTGSAQPNLNTQIIKDYIINAPNLSEQQTIAATLSCLDDKIELNNKINVNLETQAQAIFKSRFIDFEPFKDGEFVKSELGLIPKGWKIIKFSEFLSLSTYKSNETNIPEYSVTNTGIHPREKTFRKRLSKVTSKNKIVYKDNLVFGMSREILNWGLMKDEIGGVSSAYHVFSIDKHIINPQYVEEFMKVHLWYFKNLIRPGAREGQGIDKTALFNKEVYIPPETEYIQYVRIRDFLNEDITHNIRQMHTLTTLRDTLLPKLMNGEIKVPVTDTIN